MNDVSTFVLRARSDIAEATMAQLLATYNALTGKSLKKFENKEIAQRRVDMAMMAAQDADAHLGVPKGANGEVKTAEELTAKAAEVGQPAPQMNDEAPKEDTPKFPEGSLAAELAKKGAAAPAVTRQPKAPAPPKRTRAEGEKQASIGRVAFVLPAPTDRKVRETSARGILMARMNVVLAEDPAATDVDVAALSEHLGADQRSHIQKLVNLGFLRITASAPKKPPAPRAPKAAPVVEEPKAEPVVATDLDGTPVELPGEEQDQPEA